MKTLKWIPIFLSMALFGQQTPLKDSLTDILLNDSTSHTDTGLFQTKQNSFLEEDDLLRYGFNPFEEATHSNIGSPLIPIWWKPKNNLKLNIGDPLLENLARKPTYTSVYQEHFPHTKIIYVPAILEGQKLNIIHQRPYKYGSVLVDYYRLVSEGYLIHEKSKSSHFSIYGNFRHPKVPYESEWRFHALKNKTNWNGGVTNDELFLSNNLSNWELLPVKWGHLNTTTNRKGLDWKHSYQYSDVSHIEYELNVSWDSLLYDELQDDTLFYPAQTNASNSLTRVFTNTNHTFRWNKKIDADKSIIVGIGYQNFDYETSQIKQGNLYTALSSKSLNNQVSLNYGRGTNNRSNIKVNFKQNIFLLGVNHELRLAFEKTLPNWMKQNNYSYQSQNSLASDFPKPTTDRFVEWDMKINKDISLHSTYHILNDFHYYNESGILKTSEKTIQIFQSRLKHKLCYKKWNWIGELGYQNSSNTEIPLANFLTHQKIYWQGNIIKNATLAQLGTRIRYKSSHPGMNYSPFIGDYLVDPSYKTDASLRLDIFANFQIKTVKIFLTYEHSNALVQGNQYILKPYPMNKPFFRMSLIWNFYD